MSDSFLRERATAVSAARVAARLCTEVRSSFDGASLSKDDKSPVTVADFGSQAAICRMIRNAYPDDPIVAEEDSSALRSKPETLEEVRRLVEAQVGGASADDVCTWIDAGDAAGGNGRFWTVDPIDGTKGFLRGDQYAVAIALVVEGEPVVGALACPALQLGGREGVVLVAVRGGGTYVLPVEDDDTQELKISVSGTSSPEQAVFSESLESGHSAHGVSARAASILGITSEPLRLDSQAKYGLVAAGEADVYMRIPRGDYVEKIWDHAAGALITAEAGGVVTDLDGRALDFSQGRTLLQNRGILATNGRLHQSVLDAVRAATEAVS